MRALRLICASLVLTAALARPAEPDLGLPSASWQAGIPWPGSVRAKRGVDLIKAIEDYCRELFKTDPAFAAARTVLGEDEARRAIVRDAILYQVWAGIEDFSVEYFTVLQVASAYQRMRGALVRRALQELDHGLAPFDVALISGSSRVVDAYDPFLFAWLRAVQSPASLALARVAEEGGHVPEELMNHYTIIVPGEDPGNYTQVPYAIYFAEQFGPLLKALDDWLADLEAVPAANETEKQAYLEYLQQYRACMTETQIDLLEPTCAQVDVKWMAVKGWVQVVHDLETGYGDPLRTKMQPEFSVRLLDSTQCAANRAIQRISDVIQAFYKARDTPLAREGLAALAKQSFGIYYHAVLGGFNMQFRSIGQSVPNRAEVRTEYGVKMFFDLAAVQGKQGPTRGFAKKVLANQTLVDMCMNATETTVWQTAGHELGHAIYNLASLPEHLPEEVEAPMEEGRADFTALRVLLLMLRSGDLTEAEVSKYSCGWLVDQIRRFPQWGTPSLQGYLMSAAAMWAQAAEVGFASVNSEGRVELDLQKAEAWLEAAAEVYSSILDACDAPGSTAALSAIWQSGFVGAGESPIVRHLVSMLKGSSDGQLQLGWPHAEEHEAAVE